MDPRAELWPTSPRLARTQVREVVESVVSPDELEQCEIVWLAGPEGPSGGIRSGVPEMPTGGPGLNLWVRVLTNEQEWWHATWRSGLSWTQGLRHLGSNLAQWVSGSSQRPHREADMPTSLPDLHELTDEEVIDLISLAGADSRDMLIMVLGYSRGAAGPPYLRQLLRATGKGSVHVRTAALGALVEREGTRAGPDLVSLLSGVPLEVQVAAALCLAELDDGRYASELFAWLERRLRAQGRDSWEVSGILRYAARVNALAPVARLLDSHEHRLASHEVEHLDLAWPATARARFLATGDPAFGPDLTALDDWFDMNSTRNLDEQRSYDIFVEFVGPIIDRLRRKATGKKGLS